MSQTPNQLTQAGAGGPADRASFFGSLWRRPAEERREADLLRRLVSLAFTQVGHSRRIAAAPVRLGRTLVFPYVCETGFEHRRQSHRWLVAARELDHACCRATVTAQDWLIAAAWSPAYREILLADSSRCPEAATQTEPASGTEPASVKPVPPPLCETDRACKTEPASVKPVSPTVPLPPPRFTFVVEDEDEWRRRLRGPLSAWFAAQPVERSWEIAPGLLVASEAARPVESAPRELADAVEQLAPLLTPA